MAAVYAARPTEFPPHPGTLTRTPAAAGHVDTVLRDNWTQADVERELCRSDEYCTRRSSIAIIGDAFGVSAYSRARLTAYSQNGIFRSVITS